MGLTRISAQQISNIDYKQAVRVITVSNVTFSGSAPASVDGVSLATNDRILVAGQTTGSQNGLYIVQTVGSGSSGNWVRASDSNSTGELEAGTIVMVTEGNVFKDTQWKLTTNNPIVIGTTSLTFEQNSAFAFGNIYANSTAVLANTVGDTLTLTAGNNISITGNAAAKSVTIGVTGISLNSISNGTSNVNVVSSNGNITISVAGTSNVAEFSSTGVYVPGIITTAGNMTIGGSLTAGRINSNLIPTTDITYSLGNATHRWSNLYLAGNTIYLGNSIITENSNGDVVIDNTGSFAVPVGTTLQRSEVTGAIRYNTTAGVFETYDGVGWNSLAYGTATDLPFGDYGSVGDVATTDAFGVSITSTFDCGAEGPMSYNDLATGEAYVGA